MDVPLLLVRVGRERVQLPVAAGARVREQEAGRLRHQRIVGGQEGAVAGHQVLLPYPEPDLGTGGDGPGVVVRLVPGVTVELPVGVPGAELVPRSVEAHRLRYADPVVPAAHVGRGPRPYRGQVPLVEPEVGGVEVERAGAEVRLDVHPQVPVPVRGGVPPVLVLVRREQVGDTRLGAGVRVPAVGRRVVQAAGLVVQADRPNGPARIRARHEPGQTSEHGQTGAEHDEARDGQRQEPEEHHRSQRPDEQHDREGETLVSAVLLLDVDGG